MKLRKFLAGCSLVYFVILIGITVFQRDFLYFPNPAYVSPEAGFANSRLKELFVTTEDGIDLKGWYAPATSQSLSLVYFHGNADSLQKVAPIATPYISAGYGFLIVEYRGYSGFSGNPTEKGLYADGRAFLNKLSALGVEEKNIVLLGHSLGTGVATQMATEFHVHGLMLIAPFLSASKMGQIRFPFLPAELLTIDRYENFKKIPKLKLPLLIATGGKDIVVPPAHGEELFELGNEPKQFYFSPESGHNNLFGADLYPVSLKWLGQLALEN
jgi:uncharacterized protein